MSKADGPDEAAGDDAQKEATFAGRLTETGKWAVGILGAAGTFAVGNFLSALRYE